MFGNLNVVGEIGRGDGGEGSSSVGFMITLALFLHKAPEAAGYGTFIVHMNQPFLKRLGFLVAYSISSPISAFIAYTVFAL